MRRYGNIIIFVVSFIIVALADIAIFSGLGSQILVGKLSWVLNNVSFSFLLFFWMFIGVPSLIAYFITFILVKKENVEIDKLELGVKENVSKEKSLEKKQLTVAVLTTIILGVMVTAFIHWATKPRFAPYILHSINPGELVQPTIITPSPFISEIGSNTLASPTAFMSPTDTELCNFTINLPDGYYYDQAPINSFYGNTDTKNQKGQICKIILGPHYKAGYEGFTGEQIQINIYPTALTGLNELIKQSTQSSAYLPLHAYRFKRPSYGGEDEVLVFENNFKLYEIFWRNDPNDIEDIVKQIVAQL